MKLDENLEQALYRASLREGHLKKITQEDLHLFRQLDRMGYLSLDQKATGMGIVNLTVKGEEYLEGYNIL
jgi:hypothetical protein